MRWIEFSDVQNGTHRASTHQLLPRYKAKFSYSAVDAAMPSPAIADSARSELFDPIRDFGVAYGHEELPAESKPSRNGYTDVSAEVHNLFLLLLREQISKQHGGHRKITRAGDREI